MDGEEYEVESVTRARVHDKRGKKITWKYYVKWKGYDWDDNTWEPTESFQDGSEHILESFWQRVNTGGRDISDAKLFKKGEELLISGPPGKKSLKRQSSTAKLQHLPVEEAESTERPIVSSPPLAPRKRRKLLVSSDDDASEPKSKRQAKLVATTPHSKRRVSTAGQKREEKPMKSPKRRRASSPGPRKVAPKRQPSVKSSECDADGETDPDVIEVEDELMQISAEEVDEHVPQQESKVLSRSSSAVEAIKFDDLEHFYTKNPIEIEQPGPDPEPWTVPQTPEPQTSLPLTRSSPDPLFDSPSDFNEHAREGRVEPSVPFHRARATKPLVKLLDAPVTKSTSTAITAKARLMSVPSTDTSSGAGSGHAVAKQMSKPNPDRHSTRLLQKNRSSLLVGAKGGLKTVKRSFSSINSGRDQPDGIEEATSASGKVDRGFTITSWSDEDAVGDTDPEDQTLTYPPDVSTPSGEELLKLAGLEKDTEPLPDFEEAIIAQEGSAEARVDPSILMERTASGGTEDIRMQTTTSAATQNPVESPPPISEPSPHTTVPAETTEAPIKDNVALAKEQLFPSAHSTPTAFNDASFSFRSTIFGPLYQGASANHASADGNVSSTTFKVVLGDAISIPVTLKDVTQMKGRMYDVTVGNSVSGKAATFYSPDDALAIVSTLKSSGTARVVPDVTADDAQKEQFVTFLERFQAMQTLLAPVDKELCVFYSSENSAVAEKLSAPRNLVGLSRTLLVSRAYIENQLAYVGAAFSAKAL